MINRKDFKAHLVWAESLENFVYKDSVGILTIGVGRNLEDRGISDDEAMHLLGNDIENVIEDCRGLDYWDTLDPVRQLCIADMVFNMGLGRFRQFVNTNKALAKNDYNLAAAEMIDSKWYKQVGRRAKKLVEAMETGKWPT